MAYGFIGNNLRGSMRRNISSALFCCNRDRTKTWHYDGTHRFFCDDCEWTDVATWHHFFGRCRGRTETWACADAFCPQYGGDHNRGGISTAPPSAETCSDEPTHRDALHWILGNDKSREMSKRKCRERERPGACWCESSLNVGEDDSLFVGKKLLTR